MSDVKFAQGLIVKQNPNRPSFVIASLSVNVAEFSEFCKQNQNNGWVNLDMLIGKSGKPYAKLNDWKPKEQSSEQPTNYNQEFVNEEDGLPF